MFRTVYDTAQQYLFGNRQTHITLGRDPDFNTEKYQPNNAYHEQYITNNIILFEKALSDLLHTDKYYIAIPAGLAASSWLIGVASTGTIGLGILLAYFLMPHKLQERQACSTNFSTQLDKLFQIYCWCTKELGARITYDKTGLALISVLAPFASIDELMLWDKKQEISADFQKILVDADLMRAAPTGNRWVRFAKHTFAEAKFTIYGHSQPPGIAMAEEPVTLRRS